MAVFKVYDSEGKCRGEVEGVSVDQSRMAIQYFMTSEERASADHDKAIYDEWEAQYIGPNPYDE